MNGWVRLFVSAVVPLFAHQAATAQVIRHQVRPGETLQSISRRYFGTTRRWLKMFDQNKSVLKTPDSLEPGIILTFENPGDAPSSRIPPTERPASHAPAPAPQFKVEISPEQLRRVEEIGRIARKLIERSNADSTITIQRRIAAVARNAIENSKKIQPRSVGAGGVDPPLRLFLDR